MLASSSAAHVDSILTDCSRLAGGALVSMFHSGSSMSLMLSASLLTLMISIGQLMPIHLNILSGDAVVKPDSAAAAQFFTRVRIRCFSLLVSSR